MYRCLTVNRLDYGWTDTVTVNRLSMNLLCMVKTEFQIHRSSEDQIEEWTMIL